MFQAGQTPSIFSVFASQSTHLQPAPLVPTHPDPSPVNLLVTENSLILIDWDDVSLSDPLRDIGVMLWWYLPRSACKRFSTHTARGWIMIAFSGGRPGDRSNSRSGSTRNSISIWRNNFLPILAALCGTKIIRRLSNRDRRVRRPTPDRKFPRRSA